jgi:hypothetical protein
VSFSLGVETESASVAEAFQKNNHKLNAVVVALKSHGVKAAEIQTSNFTITSREEDGKKRPGFRVSNVVTITREDPSGVSELLQASVDAGANQAAALRFFVANPKPLQDHGIELAFHDARAKAEKLAALSGRKLGDVICVSDQIAYNKNASMGVSETITVTAAAPSIEIGLEELNFGVAAVFELK